jgi:hypothetical protein
MKMRPKYENLIPPSGKLITEDLIEKISREAEQGWDVDELLRWKELDPVSEPTSKEGAPTPPSRPSRQRR